MTFTPGQVVCHPSAPFRWLVVVHASRGALTLIDTADHTEEQVSREDAAALVEVGPGDLRDQAVGAVLSSLWRERAAMRRAS